MMHVMTLMWTLAALGAAPRTAPVGEHEVRVPAAWAPADSADAIWREARSAFSDGDWELSARLFKRIYEKYPKSAYAGDAMYYAAYASFKLGDAPSLRRALGQLETQARKYPASSTVKNHEAKSLATRIEGGLARLGDSQAAASVVDKAARAASSGAAGYGASASAGAASAAAARAEADMARAGAGMGRAEAAEARAAAREARAALGDSYGGAARASSGFGSSGRVPDGCKSEDEDDRVEALNALLQMNAEQALPILKKVMAKREKCSEMLRRKAVFLISQKRSDESAQLLLDAARNDPDADVREQAVFWLSQVSGDQAEEFLTGLLTTSKDVELQKKAVFSLSQRRSEKAQKALRDYAAREDVPGDTRQEVIFWIGQKRSEENAQFLRGLFAKASNGDIREKILFSLSQMRGYGNEPFLLEQVANTKLSLELRKQALFWAGQGRDVTSAQLAGIYDKSPEHDMRDQVIFVLSQRSNRDAAATDKLLDIARNEKDRELRKQAIFWLGQSKDPRAAKALLELIDR